MPRFFIDTDPQTSAILGGEDGRHIARSLRMQPGEEVTLCNGRGLDFRCEITAISCGKRCPAGGSLRCA